MNVHTTNVKSIDELIYIACKYCDYQRVYNRETRESIGYVAGDENAIHEGGEFVETWETRGNDSDKEVFK